MMYPVTIVNAMQSGPRNGKIGMEARVAGVIAVVSRLYSIKGMGGDKESISKEIAFAAHELEREIALKYPFMTMSEIQYALEAGVKGELDNEPTYLNVANYSKWLRLYRNSRERLEALQAVENGQHLAAPAQQIEAGTVESRNEATMPTAFEQMCEEVHMFGHIDKSHFDGTCAAVYDWLRAQGRMPRPDAKTGQAAMDAAVKAVKPMKRGGDEPFSIDRIIEGAMGQVKARAKRILLEQYIKTI